jgi:cyclic beta-1,2-glucan synthetase
MGSGDWNDGMNRVGQGGQGESVWLGFFLHAILGQMVPICTRRGDQARAGERDALCVRYQFSCAWLARPGYRTRGLS